MFLITICVFPSMYYLNHYLKLKSEVDQLQYVYVYDFAENLYNYKYGKDYHKSNLLNYDEKHMYCNGSVNRQACVNYLDFYTATEYQKCPDFTTCNIRHRQYEYQRKQVEKANRYINSKFSYNLYSIKLMNQVFDKWYAQLSSSDQTFVKLTK